MSEDGYNDIAGVRRVQYWYQANAGTGGHTTTDNDGKFRLVRSGSDITAYHWDSGTSSWQTYTSWTYTGYGDPVWVGLSVFTNQHPVISGSFSNFIFNDGGDTRSDAGSYISPIYDSGRTVTWGNLSWEETLPSGTDIELQMAFSANEEGPWNFVGPDGTSGTKFTTSSGQSVHGSPSSRYCRYKAYLTGDGTDTPTLGTVELGFSGNLDSQIRTFAFDDAGNMTEKITKSDSSLIEETRTYNDLNQITQNQIDDGTTVTTWTFTHDDNGNMTSKTDGTDTYTYVWNEDNHLESVELNSSPVVDYLYDSGSRMLQRTQGSTTTNFHWDGWDLVREEKDDGVDVEVTNYLVPHGEILAFERDDEWFYLCGDGLSSTQLVTDENGNQAARFVYGAWGETLSANDSVPGGLDVRFVGGLGVRNDSATGLVWMRHRWFDSTLGRFISRDPIGLAGGANLYEYCAGRVTTFADPTGLKVSVSADLVNACDELLRQLGWTGFRPPFEQRFAEALVLARKRLQELLDRQNNGENSCGCKVPSEVDYDSFLNGSSDVTLSRSSSFPDNNSDLAKIYRNIQNQNETLARRTKLASGSVANGIHAELQLCAMRSERLAETILHELTHIGLELHYGSIQAVIDKFGTDHPVHAFGIDGDGGIDCHH